MLFWMDDRLSVAIVDDHTRLVASMRTAARGSRLRVLGPYAPLDLMVHAGADVILVDLDRDDGRGLATLLRVCENVQGMRVVAATVERDPELGSAIVTAGASGLLLLGGDGSALEDGLRRAVGGELVLPDEHLTSLVTRLRIARDERAGASALASLTSREFQVLDALAHGQSTAEIAAIFCISRMTVQSHVQNVLTKLGVHSTVEAVRLAWRSGAIAMPATA
jgi:two-component system nitrate/nitrite response regulator NarL